MPAIDVFRAGHDLPGPSDRTIDIDVEKSNSAELSYVIRAFRCDAAGTVSFVDTAGNTRSVTMAAGGVHDLCRVKQVRVTGTTATGILGYV